MYKQSILLLLSAVVIQTAKFPSHWTKCPKVDNEECLKKAVTFAIQDLSHGNRELNVIPLDPLHFDEIELKQSKESPVSINLLFSDIDLNGSKRLQINYIKIDWDNYDIVVDVTIGGEPAFIEGNYVVDGKILALPIKGNGKCNISLENLGIIITIKGEELMKNNKKYFKVTEGNAVIRSTKVSFWFDNLFDGRPDLGENMNKFLNEHWEVMLNELGSAVTEALRLSVTQISDSFFERIPVTDLYQA